MDEARGVCVSQRRHARQGRSRWSALLTLAIAIAPHASARQGSETSKPSSSVPAVRVTREEAVKRILTEALARGRAYAKLLELCKDYPHRLSGLVGLAGAEEWAQRTLVGDGFENVRLEEVTVPHWERGSIARLDVAQPPDARDTRLPILALGGSVATPVGGIEAELVVVRDFDELRGLGEAARGKIVLFNRPMDPADPDPFHAYGRAVDQRAQGAVEAARAGALAAIVRSMTLRLDDVPHTGSMRYADGVPRVPAAAVSTAGAERLAALVRSRPNARVRLELDCKELPDATAHNVIAQLRGYEFPDEIVAVGGHLDCWDVGQGAHDDGSGCVQAMEALRLIRASGLAPRRTLRCVLWVNEENGLRGAVAYKDAHAAELERHVLVLESDRGGFAPRGFGTNAKGAAFESLRAIVDLLAPYGAGELVRGGGGPDTTPLERAGLNVMEFRPDAARYFDFHHSARDTVDQVHPRELELSAGVIAALLWCVADLDAPLPRTPPPAEEPAKH